MPDQLLPVPQVPDGLREAAQRGILIPFIGAGVSRLAGCPSWAEFADAALRWLIFDGKFTYSQLDQIRHLHPRVKLSLARTLAAEKNTVVDFRALLHPKARREHEKGCRLYRSIFALGKTFVTTNYDEWLDERLPEPTPAAVPAVRSAPADTSPVKPIRVVHKVEELLPALLSEPNTVIHLHGSSALRSRRSLQQGEVREHNCWSSITSRLTQLRRRYHSGDAKELKDGH